MNDSSARLASLLLVLTFVMFLTGSALAQGLPSGDVVITASTVWPTGAYQLNSLTVSQGATLTIGGGSTVTVATSVSVTGNSMILLQGANTTPQSDGTWQGTGVAITAASIQVDAGSAISADGQGYPGGDCSNGNGSGPGGAGGGSCAGGTNGSGGSYGGLGHGGNVAATYGSSLAPTDLGSGGTAGESYGPHAGGAGGGAIRLIVSGTLMDNGVISANGGDSSSAGGAGAGGSLYVTVGTLAGTGLFAANGGSSWYGGGGGRVAVNYTTNNGFDLTKITANGGTGGGATGTVYTVAAGADLTVSENVVLPPNLNLNFTSITVNNQGTLTLGSNTTLAASTITVSGGGNFNLGGGSTVTVSGTVLVTGNSTMTLQGLNTAAPVGGNWLGTGVTLNAGNLQVDAGSHLSADGQGYQGGDCTTLLGAGPGGGTRGACWGSAAGSGGTYGGAGNANSSATYGSDFAPTDLGSGGGAGESYGTHAGGAGGGAMRLIVSNTFTNNGTVTANGSDANSAGGAGAGGSIYVTTGTLAGTGVFTANGGSSWYGGGGGRVAVYANALAGFTGFAGSTAFGQNGGSNGTVLFVNTSTSHQNLYVDKEFTIGQDAVTTYDSITVENGGTLTIGGGSNLMVTGAITVSNGSKIVLLSKNNSTQIGGQWVGQGVTLSAASVLVDATSQISADANGYIGGYCTVTSGAGPGGAGGGGCYGGAFGSGGSYGGLGGGANVFPTYGSDLAPTDLGSGGSTGESYGVHPGGAGGGALRLIVSGTLTNDGTISANGGASSSAGGSGAGGSVYVTTNTLAGSGAFQANGGSSWYGGGGGRVAVYYNALAGYTGFAASTAAAGGGSGAGAGTVAFIDTSSPHQSLFVDKEFTIPQDTVVSYDSITVDSGGTLTIGGGAKVTVTGTFKVTNNSTVLVQSENNTVQINSQWLGAGATISAGNLQVDAGSRITADGQGYLGGNCSVASGAGPGGAGGGGCYGGAVGSGGSYGGAGSGVNVAAAYGAAFAPLDLGSSGAVGEYYGVHPGGAGGGAIRLIVSGTLTNNGSISANGSDSNSNGGGGAGGSLYVTTGILTGSGSFNANGGSGYTWYPGGGGRIAIFYAANNSFGGFETTTANGGSGGGGKSTKGSVVFVDTTQNDLEITGGQGLVLANDGSLSFHDIALQNGATLEVGGGATVTASDTLSLAGNATIFVHTKNDSAQVTGLWAGQGATLSAANLQLDASSQITATGLGYVGGNCSSAPAGPGQGGFIGCPGGGLGTGGSYGGLGSGPHPAVVYGSAFQPTDPGSGGSAGESYGPHMGGAGGGAIRLQVSNTLTNHGIISANGADSSSDGGPGAGGSIYVSTALLAGGGKFTANGGSSNYGGGGGRIAIYYTTNNGFDPTLTTANGGPGAQEGSVLFVDANQNLLITGGQGLVLYPDAMASYNNVSLQDGATIILAGGSTLNAAGTLSLTGNSTIVVQSKDNTSQVGGQWLGAGATISAANLSIDAGASITADGQGYAGGTCALSPAGPGGPVSPGCPGGVLGSGGSYGGIGSGPNPAATYGSAAAPTDLGSGGSAGESYGPHFGGAGGGAIRLLVSNTLTNNGTITANGAGSSSDGGSGSGGSIYASAGILAGSGVMTANGGAGGYGGGGGRVAVYYVKNNGFDPASVTATGGGAATAGSVIFSNAPQFRWMKPAANVLHDTVTLAWAADAVDLTSTTVTVKASGPQTLVIASAVAANSSTSFDTTTLPDGRYELRLIFKDAGGNTLQELPRTVVINNSVVWHMGTIPADEEWTADKVHALDGVVIIPSGVTVTIDPGTVVKALPGAQIIVQAGGILNALGTDGNPVIFTTFDDSSVGGDSDFSSGQSLPTAGEWNGITVQGNGQFNANGNTDLRYVQFTRSGTLPGDQTWLGTYVYRVTNTVVVPSGVTLTIQPGAIVKFDANQGITVQAGGTLIAEGTLAQPIYFTSVNDNSIGGIATGSSGAPAAGDWNSIAVDSANATFEYVQLLYGGGPVSNSVSMGSALQVDGNSTVTFTNSILRASFWDGILAGYPNNGGTVTATNDVFSEVEGRAINAWPGSVVHVLNDTFDHNGVGIMAHGGVVDMANSIVANSTGANGWQAVFACCGGSFSSISSSDVWTSVAGVGNYNFSDPTGYNGNLSANPRFVNESQGDFRLNYGSPAIDAGDGLLAPATDFLGAPRYSDPRTTSKTGMPNLGGNYPDMGAFEFVESATSDIDLTASAVTGPAGALAGSQVQLTWTDTNLGSGTAQGPWHDAIYLVRDPDTNPVELLAGEVLVGNGVTLGPGASFTASATVRVPGSTLGNHRWAVKVNSRGEVFEGQNTANNTGTSLNTVALDLPELVTDRPALANTFAAAGQSWWYKLTPGTGKSVSLALALSASASGTAGAAQLFLGQGYVPDPQHFDIDQTEFNSPSASVVIPRTSSQTYYVTAYAQSLTAAPTAFTLSATSLQFSLTAVQPGSAVNTGMATLVFVGGDLTASAVYQLVGPNQAVYTASSVFLTDSAHASVTFNLENLPPGSYAAQVTQDGVTVILNNALTVTARSGGTVATFTPVQFNLEVPQAVRAGFGGTVTVNYQNISSSDAMAPMFWLSANGADLAQIPPSCAGCSAKFDSTYESLFASGHALGINFQGPAGVLPPGGKGSIGFYFAPTIRNGSIDFTVNTIGNPGAVLDWASLESSLRPDYIPAEAWAAIYANFVSAVGTTVGNYNQLLADDATYLSRLGAYDYRVSELYSFELQKAGLQAITNHYRLSGFGRGGDDVFSTWIDTSTGLPVIHYPDGFRSFLADPNNAGQYLGEVGDSATLGYDAATQSWTLTERNGLLAHFVSDPGAANRYRFDYVQDTNGIRTTAGYTNDLVTSLTDTSTGDTTAFTYNAQGRIVQGTDALGRVTSYSYDSAGEHLLSISAPGGTTQFTYVTGQGAAREHALASVTYPNGAHEYFQYDSHGRLVQRGGDSGAPVVTYAYDSTGAVTVTDGNGNASQLFPDENGQLNLYTDPLGAITRLSFDPEQKLTAVTGADGAVASFAYDSQGYPAYWQDPLGNQTNFSYGALGNLLSLTDSLGNTMSYSYDAGVNLTAITYPDHSAGHATYDSRGNLAKWTNRRGRSITYTYDANNLLTSETYANGSQITYAYDSHRNLVAVNTAAGVTSLTYDAADRLTGIGYPNGRFIQYTYNSGGQRTRQADSTGYIVNYAYDAGGRLAQLTDGNGHRIIAYTYDSAGELARKDMGNGSYSTFAYDAAGNLAHLTNHAANGAILSQFDYTHDGKNHIAGMTTPAGAWSYEYDADGQLTAVTLPGGSAQYSYDAAGNRISSSMNGSATHYSVNNLNEYTAAGGGSYRYDADGNLIAGGGWNYSYDDRNQLTAMTSATDAWTFEYDALGNRAAAVHNGSRIEYLTDPAGLGNVFAEFDGGGNLLTHYAYGLDLASATPAGGMPQYFLFDGTGNTAQRIDTAGTVVDSYSYLPFGEKLASSGLAANPLTYAGQFGVRDDGNGLYFMRQRWYSPALGRFLQADPSGLAGGDTNFYRYGLNSPVNFNDPGGLLWGAVWSGISTAWSNYNPLQTLWNTQNQVQNNYNQAINLASNPNLHVGCGSVLTASTAGAHITPTLQAASAAVYSGAIASYGTVGTVANAPSTFTTLGAVGSGGNSLMNSYYGPGGPGAMPPGGSGGGGGGGQCCGDRCGGGGHPGGYSPLLPSCKVIPCPKPKPPTPCTDCGGNPYIGNGGGGGGGGATGSTGVFSSHDPNAKMTVGYGAQGFIPPDTAISYTIMFENQSSASAPAAEVVVTDPLDAQLDWSTVQLTQIAFNNVTLTVPAGAQSYSGQATVATDKYPVSVQASLNPASGVLTWTMQSIDPTTGTLPADPFAGFLPPNDSSNHGVGSVTFTVQPKASLANGAVITNQASIVFDVNAAISTNTVSNTIDAVYPLSSIDPLPATEATASFPVSWSGTDTGGAGIAVYDVYVATDGGAYTLWLPGTALPSATFNGALGHSYSFYSMATDHIGRRQQSVGTVQTTATAPAIITPTLNWPAPAAIAYGTALSAAQLNATAGVPGQFTYTPALGTVLPVGMQTLSVSFAPSDTTHYAAATASVSLQVTAIQPTITVSCPAATFNGAAHSCTASATGIGGVVVSGSFSFSPASETNAGSYTVTATFTSSDANYSNASGSGTLIITQVVASLSISPASLQLGFGPQLVNSSSVAQYISLTNTGQAPLVVGPASARGPFAISDQAGTCTTGMSLPAARTCVIRVVFAPVSAGPASGAVMIGGASTVTLSGSGQPPAAVATITPAALTFANPQTVGSASPAQYVQIASTGSAALQVSGMTLGGANPQDFVVSDQAGTCNTKPTTLAYNAKCNLRVLFTPTATGTRTAILYINDNASGSPQVVTLTGTAISAGQLTLSATALTFNPARTGAATAAQYITLKSVGSGAVTVSSAVLGGSTPGDFVLSDQVGSCTTGATLVPGASCNLRVIFTPKAAGARSATITITDSTGGHSVTLGGTGQ